MADRAGKHATEVWLPALSADQSEAKLLARFTAHALFREIERLEQSAFLEVLLQRRFLSLLFPVMYDLGIDGLENASAIRLAREILREEYPDPSGHTPSHREDLVSDLLLLGATKSQIAASRPTAVTASVIQETLALMLDAAAAGSDLRILAILRWWGEVLVSVEYGEFRHRMDRQFRAAGVASRFYNPHQQHDGRDPLVSASESAATHSGRLGAHLALLLATDDDARQFAQTEQRVLATRVRFYDQFIAAEHPSS